MTNERVYKMTFWSVYPLLVQKAERKGRTKIEVDSVICWLTGYDDFGLQAQIQRYSYRSDELLFLDTSRIDEWRLSSLHGSLLMNEALLGNRPEMHTYRQVILTFTLNLFKLRS